MTRLLAAAAISALTCSVLTMAACASGDTAASKDNVGVLVNASAVQADVKSGVLPKELVDPYVKLAESLAKDNLDGVKDNASKVAAVGTVLGAETKIEATAGQLAAASQIADAREKFGTLSEAVVAYMDEKKLKLPDDVRVASCPMVQKPWMQKGADIANPYFGASMLTCGSFR